MGRPWERLLWMTIFGALAAGASLGVLLDHRRLLRALDRPVWAMAQRFAARTGQALRWMQCGAPNPAEALAAFGPPDVADPRSQKEAA